MQARFRLTVAGVLLASLAGCNAGPTVRPSGSTHALAVVVQLSGPATATVTLTDRSGLVDGIAALDKDTLTVSSDESQTLLENGYLVRAVAGSNDLGLLWTSGVCYPTQTVDVDGTPRHLDIKVRLIPPVGDGACELVGGGPALRIALASHVDPANVTVAVVFS